MHKIYTVTMFTYFAAKDHLQCDKSNIKVSIKSYTYIITLSHRSLVHVRLFWESWEQFHVTDITCNFLETNFLNKLILHSVQFIICANIPYKVLDNQQKKTFVSLTKASNIFLLNSVADTTKKSTCSFLCSLHTLFPVNWLYSDKNHLKIIGTKLLHSFF